MAKVRVEVEVPEGIDPGVAREEFLRAVEAVRMRLILEAGQRRVPRAEEVNALLEEVREGLRERVRRLLDETGG